MKALFRFLVLAIFIVLSALLVRLLTRRNKAGNKHEQELGLEEDSQSQAIPDEEVVYRLASYSNWKDPDDDLRFLPIAFELQPTRDRLAKQGRTKDEVTEAELEEYLSVLMASHCTVDDKGRIQGIEGFDFKPKGVAKLTAGAIRVTGKGDPTYIFDLDVKPKPPPQGHAGIINVPHWVKEERKAQRIADLLASRFERIA